MKRKPSQWVIVLQMLRDAGARGVHTFEIYDRYVMNPSQRISELEKRGHKIATKREKRGDAIGARYTLVHDADSPAPVADVFAEPEPLFTPPPQDAIRGAA